METNKLKERTNAEIDAFLEKFKEIWQENRKKSFGWLCKNIMAESYKYYDFHDGADEDFLERIVEYREFWMKEEAGEQWIS